MLGISKSQDHDSQIHDAGLDSGPNLFESIREALVAVRQVCDMKWCVHLFCFVNQSFIIIEGGTHTNSIT